MKKLLKITGIVLLPVLLWLAFVLLYREPLDEGLVAFYKAEVQVPPNRDAAVFLDGITADAKADVIEQGLLVAQFSRMIGSDTKLGGDVQPTMSDDELNCWAYGDVVVDAKAPCATPERVALLLKENKLLLQRYGQMSALNYFGTNSQNSKVFLQLNKLLSAQILVEAKQGKQELAYQHWRDNFAFLTRIAGDRSGWAAKGTILGSYGFAQNTLEALLHEHPELGRKHADELNELLSSTVGIWRFEEAIRSEYEYVDEQALSEIKSAWVDTNFIRNRIYRRDQALIKVLKNISPESLRDQSESLMAGFQHQGMWSVDFLRNPISAIVANQALSSQSSVSGLVLHMWKRDAFNRLLRLHVLLIKESVPGNKMPEFLDKSRADLKSPFDQLPMAWAPTQRVLWFANNADCSRIKQLRLPQGRFLTPPEISQLKKTDLARCS